MKTLNSFHPFINTPKTTNPNTNCSTHYFKIKNPILNTNWYNQNLHLVNISNTHNVHQVNYYHVTNTNTNNPSSNS